VQIAETHKTDEFKSLFRFTGFDGSSNAELA